MIHPTDLSLLVSFILSNVFIGFIILIAYAKTRRASENKNQEIKFKFLLETFINSAIPSMSTYKQLKAIPGDPRERVRKALHYFLRQEKLSKTIFL